MRYIALGFLSFIKEIFEEKRTLLYSLGFIVLIVLVSANMTLAIAAGAAATLSLTVSSALTSALGRYSTLIGSRIIYVSITSLFTALAAVFVILKFPDISDLFSVIAVILPVSSFAMMHYSKSDSVIYSAVRTFSAGFVFTAAAFTLSIIREFFGCGTLFGMEVSEFDIPFLRESYGTFIICGIVLAVFNAVFAKNMSKISKKVKKNSINTEADDADS